MDSKKIVAIAVLIAVIVAAAVFTAKRSASDSTAPTDVVGIKIDKIDMKTNEVITETAADWDNKYTPDQFQRYKNPKTGAYTMVGIMKCASCGKQIPVPQLPDELLQKVAASGGKGINMGKYKQEMIAAQMKALREYKCPLCGKLAAGGGPAEETK